MKGLNNVHPCWMFLARAVIGFAADLGPLLMDKLEPAELVPVAKVRAELEKLMDAGLEELTAEAVKEMMAAIIRQHLGWLVVWRSLGRQWHFTLSLTAIDRHPLGVYTVLFVVIVAVIYCQDDRVAPGRKVWGNVFGGLVGIVSLGVGLQLGATG